MHHFTFTLLYPPNYHANKCFSQKRDFCSLGKWHPVNFLYIFWRAIAPQGNIFRKFEGTYTRRRLASVIILLNIGLFGIPSLHDNLKTTMAS